MPHPKAIVSSFSHFVSVRPEIDTNLFFSKRKTGLAPLDESRKIQLDEQIRKAFEFYVNQVLLPKRQKIYGTSTEIDPRSIVTLTEQRTAIKRIISAAKKVQKNLKKKNILDHQLKLIRNLEATYREADRNTNALLKKTLQIYDADFFEMIAKLNFQHQKPAPESTYNLLQRIVNFKEPSQINEVRWANPELFLLISILAPIWKEATGRSCRRTNASDLNYSKRGTTSYDKKRYMFAEAIRLVLTGAKQKTPSLDQIDKICQKIDGNLKK